jgi:hypothetical protein
VAAEIVHDDLARFQRWQQDLFDIGAEAFPVDRPIEQSGSREAIVPQRPEEGHLVPKAMWCEAAKASSFRCPSAQWSHVGLDPGLVDEDQALTFGRQLNGLVGLPGGPCAAPSTRRSLYICVIVGGGAEILYVYKVA